MGLRLIGGTVGFVFLLLTQTASAEPAFDHCGYMNHESKAYAACLSADATAAEAAKTPLVPAAQVEPAKTVPKAKPRARAETKP